MAGTSPATTQSVPVRGGRRRRSALYARPLRQGLPSRVVLGFELPAARVEEIAAGFGRERVDQQAAVGGVIGGDQSGDALEILAGLLVGPEIGAVGEPLQMEGAVVLRMADVAAHVSFAVFQKDRLDAALESFEVERLALRRHLRHGPSRQRGPGGN